MKTVLDLVGEYAELNDAKVRSGGTLPPRSERRWLALKEFYDLLMSGHGVCRRPIGMPFSSEDIRQRVSKRGRLRVPTDLYAVLEFQGDYFPGQIRNLSQGGVFLACQNVLPVAEELVVFLTNPCGRQAALLESHGEIVWTTEQGIAGIEVPRGMGIRLRADDTWGRIRTELDAIVLDTLERHLAGVDANAIAVEFQNRVQPVS